MEKDEEEKKLTEARGIIAGVAVKCCGSYKAELNTVIKKERLSSEEEAAGRLSAQSGQCLAAVDASYPEAFKKIPDPPLIFWFLGDIGVLSRKHGAAKASGNGGVSEVMLFPDGLPAEMPEGCLLAISEMPPHCPAGSEAECLDRAAHAVKTADRLGRGIA